MLSLPVATSRAVPGTTTGGGALGGDPLSLGRHKIQGSRSSGRTSRLRRASLRIAHLRELGFGSPPSRRTCDAVQGAHTASFSSALCVSLRSELLWAVSHVSCRESRLNHQAPASLPYVAASNEHARTR